MRYMYKHIFLRGLNRGWVPNSVGTPLLSLILIAPSNYLVSSFDVYLICKNIIGLFVCLFVALRPKSTAMVIAGRSVHLTTLFPGQA